LFAFLCCPFYFCSGINIETKQFFYSDASLRILLAAYDWNCQWKETCKQVKSKVMKKQFVFSSTRNAIVRFGIAALLFFNAATAFAGGGKEENPFVSIRYIGAVQDRAQFQVDLVIDNEEAYLLAIQDENGTYLYKEKISARTFTKKFEWQNDDINVSKLIFSVTGLKSKKTQVFEVASEVRTVRDVVVNKL
jgi:hypothetical protein